MSQTVSPPNRPGGRFAKGNPGGPGNPFGRQVAAMRAAYLEVVTKDDLKKLAALHLQMALDGNLAAGRLVLQYTVGKPAPVADPDRVDVDDWALQREKTVTSEQMQEAVDGVPVVVAATVVSAMEPEKIQKFLTEMSEIDANRAREQAAVDAEIAAIRRAHAAERAAQAAPPPAEPQAPSTRPAPPIAPTSVAPILSPNRDFSNAPPSTNGILPAPPQVFSNEDWNAFTAWLASQSPPDGGR